MLQITIFLYSGLIISSLCANIYSTYNVEKYELNEYLWDCSPRSSFANTYIVEGTFFMFLVGFYNTMDTASISVTRYVPLHQTLDISKSNNKNNHHFFLFYFLHSCALLFFSSFLLFTFFENQIF